MILVIAEKPSVAQSIAKVLGATSRKDGYLEGNNYIVSWCVGHLVGLADASSYDERYAKWRYDDLPIVPEEWLFEVPKDKAQQFKVLRDLMKDKRVTELVCATDAGREGELIFRLVYNKLCYGHPLGDSYDLCDEIPDPHDMEEEILSNIMLEDILSRFDERDRIIIRYYLTKELTSRQIEERYGIPRNTVSNRAMSLKKILREIYQNLGQN